ncbi:cobaltochelatase subunit CobN [Bordetella genomosp. 13]|uniref:Cobaltochelatase subunit CobN n=1 Tax=Bordetella genomosp. 13 TaxID=463040 RepID=A0A1W6Z8G9_9BORD|nr:cobaltochelatase subunit CobN [Bordetella genomosp. 13]ARP93124.1 cobaltochelatase subunit CobN [Bordetella genomosp. 13]
MRKRRWAWLWWLGVSMWAMMTAAQGEPVVQVLHNSFVSVEKFQRLQAYAQHQNLQLRHLDVERASPQAWRQALQDAALLLLDVPRPNDRAMVVHALEQQLAQATPQAGTADGPPRLVVGGGRPEWQGLHAQHGAALAALYAAGGQENFVRFFALSSAIQARREPAPALVAPPVRLPATGFYHPAAPRVFETLPDYLAWHDSHRGAAGSPPPTGRIAFLSHQGMVGDMLTRELDTLIARSEAAGLTPVVFWFDASQPGGLVRVLGKGQVDVLVNLTHMQDGAARSRDFLALDVPVIQTLNFREGEASDWPQAVSGVSARTTAVFLAGPEGWGISDPLVLSASTAGVSDPLPAQLDALLGKLQSLVALRRTPPDAKRLALMFWNYPAGETNLGASNLNIPRSVVSMQAALASEGYAVGDPVDEAQVIAAGQRMLGALYGNEPLEALLKEDMAALYPVADYERWLAGLPAGRQAELRHGGAPERHRAVREIDGKRYFVVPRWQLGQLLVMPQMPRSSEPHGHYHDTASAPDHLYMAAYLYLQEQYRAHALIHLGTHGTQEWLPGKDRGLAATDYPWLAVGSLPVFYPYIQDNVGEAIQAKRRGRAVTISHQTPPFAPAGLYDQLRDLHHLIHEYQQLEEGGVRERVAGQIRAQAVASHLNDDLGWTAAQAEQDFDGFMQAIHDHLHELARTAMPLGLHTFGQPATPEHRASTIMQQLGDPFQKALGMNEEAMLVPDPQALWKNPAYLAVRQLLASDGNGNPALPAGAQAFAQRAAELDRHLVDTQENESLLAGLAGRFVAPGSGGDPVRNPEVPSGRNLYAFEADKIPARAAYASAETAYAQLLESFRAAHGGRWPEKLAFSLWSSEAIRHLGVTEAQILHALGLRPVWDAGGRVTALQIIPAAELGRPRSDVVVQVTGVYRDQFDSFMRLLDDAMQRLAALDEPGNPIGANNRRIAARLQAEGLSADAAAAAARLRIFSNAPGEYGTGVPDLALRSTEWEDPATLGRQFLSSSRYAYGGTARGESPTQANVLAEQLRGTQAAIMSRSSNLHGVLSTDHPFEFLGGLSAAVRHLDGQAPQLLISDLRGSQPRTAGLERFLSDELRTRYLNPQWIGAMQQEGYAGTLQVLNAANNLFGWQAVDADTVRADQWQAMFDTYVADTRDLGTTEWFEQHNPTAQAQVIARMAEAIRKGYWDAPEQTRRVLAQRWQELARQHGVETGAETTRRFIADMAQGYGLQAAAAPQSAGNHAAPGQPAQGESAARANALQAVQGQVLARTQDAPAEDPHRVWVLAFMLLTIGAGALGQAVASRRLRQ